MSVDGVVVGCPGGTEEGRSPVLEQAAVARYDRCGARVVGPRGSYDMHTIKFVAEALDTAAKTYPKVVLDASGITFADSALLNLLIRIHQAADLRVAAPTQQLQRLLHLTSADTVLEIRETVDEAISS